MQAKRSAGILPAALSQLLVSPALQMMNLHSMGCYPFSAILSYNSRASTFRTSHFSHSKAPAGMLRYPQPAILTA